MGEKRAACWGARGLEGDPARGQPLRRADNGGVSAALRDAPQLGLQV